MINSGGPELLINEVRTMVMGDMEMSVDLAVIGAGPGGFAAAFRAADLGLDVALIDPYPTPGGNYLYQGRIPANTLLNIASVILEAGKLNHCGVHFSPPRLDLDRVISWRNEIVGKIGKQLTSLAKHRSIQLIKGKGRFESESLLQIEGGDISRISFKSCVIATGSKPSPLEHTDYSPGNRILDSKEIFSLKQTAGDILIVGDSPQGLEAGLIYHALGSNVWLAAEERRLLPHIDADLVLPLQNKLKEIFGKLHLETRITGLKESDTGIEITLLAGDKQQRKHFDQLLIADTVPSCPDLNLEKAGVTLNGEKEIPTDEQQQTNVENIFAVGSAAGYPEAPHIAMRQGRVAAEVIAGKRSAFDVLAVPHVLFTNPQICWCGLTEQEAKQQQIPVTVRSYDWQDSWGGQTKNREEGLTKIIADPDSGRVLGVGICGRGAESLISEGTLAIEMGCLAEDLALTLHPHPTCSESLAHCAENILGTSIFTQPSSDAAKAADILSTTREVHSWTKS